MILMMQPGHLRGLQERRPRAASVHRRGQGQSVVPPSVNESNAKHYRRSRAFTDYKEFPGRSRHTVGQDGWEEVGVSLALAVKASPIG